MPQDAPEPVVIHTDGSLLANPVPGGWAAIFQFQDNERELNGSEPNTTNNRMELTAAIMGPVSYTHLTLPTILLV